ncbi:hypothetical protein [Nostoc sp. MS1]|uniref:hypothetical protein n=1 Tax=Nostoc sp. MS1 TaxID=2764711 RepID=UPI001CC803BA|nr:hypothetical protein [Nostoc sp. MS1]
MRDRNAFLDDYEQTIRYGRCPSCYQVIIFLHESPKEYADEDTEELIYPQSINRPLASEVPKKFADEYKEACLVLKYSPKASAALSRAC